MSRSNQVHATDLRRRIVKETLIKFDGTPLFPERIEGAETITVTSNEMLYCLVLLIRSGEESGHLPGE